MWVKSLLKQTKVKNLRRAVCLVILIVAKRNPVKQLKSMLGVVEHTIKKLFVTR